MQRNIDEAWVDSENQQRHPHDYQYGYPNDEGYVQHHRKKGGELSWQQLEQRNPRGEGDDFSMYDASYGRPSWPHQRVPDVLVSPGSIDDRRHQSNFRANHHGGEQGNRHQRSPNFLHAGEFEDCASAPSPSDQRRLHRHDLEPKIHDQPHSSRYDGPRHASPRMPHPVLDAAPLRVSPTSQHTASPVAMTSVACTKSLMEAARSGLQRKERIIAELRSVNSELQSRLIVQDSQIEQLERERELFRDQLRKKCSQLRVYEKMVSATCTAAHALINGGSWYPTDLGSPRSARVQLDDAEAQVNRDTHARRYRRSTLRGIRNTGRQLRSLSISRPWTSRSAVSMNYPPPGSSPGAMRPIAMVRAASNLDLGGLQQLQPPTLLQPFSAAGQTFSPVFSSPALHPSLAPRSSTGNLSVGAGQLHELPPGGHPPVPQSMPPSMALMRAHTGSRASMSTSSIGQDTVGVNNNNTQTAPVSSKLPPRNPQTNGAAHSGSSNYSPRTPPKASDYEPESASSARTHNHNSDRRCSSTMSSNSSDGLSPLATLVRPRDVPPLGIAAEHVGCGSWLGGQATRGDTYAA